MRIIKEPIRFDWDKGNIGKNLKHQVEDEESEETFFDEYKVTLKDKVHSRAEDRYILLGKTKQGRLLYIVFTIRRAKIRIISARDINKKEVSLYEKTT